MDETRIQELRLNARQVLAVADKEGWSEADVTRHLANLALEAAESLKEAQSKIERMVEAIVAMGESGEFGEGKPEPLAATPLDRALGKRVELFIETLLPRATMTRGGSDNKSTRKLREG